MHLPRLTRSPAATDAATVSRRLTAAYVTLAAADTWLSGRPEVWGRRGRWVTKPVLMPTLVGSLVASPTAAGSPLRSATVLAELAGWGGDVSLLRDGTGAFLTGAGSFAVGHGAYLTGFLRHRRPTPLLASRAPQVVLAVAAVTTPVIAARAARHDRVIALAVPAYAGALATMTSAGLHLDPQLPRRARVLTGAGAVLFLVSDTVLAWRTFAPPPPPQSAAVDVRASSAPAVDPWERVVMATYTAAQLLLRLGAGAAGRDRGAGPV